MFRDGSYPPRLGKTDFSINGVAVFSQEHGNYLETKREKKDGA
jgi:hypothetical protein